MDASSSTSSSVKASFLRELRHVLELSQEEMAHLLAVRGRTVQRWEKGQAPMNWRSRKRLRELVALEPARSKLQHAGVSAERIARSL